MAAGATPRGVMTRSAAATRSAAVATPSAAGGGGGVVAAGGAHIAYSPAAPSPALRPMVSLPQLEQQLLAARPHDDHERIIRDLRLQLAMSRTHAAKLLLNRRDMGEVARAHAAAALAHVIGCRCSREQDLSSGLSEV